MSEQPSNRTTADWLVELCVYAPIGFALDAHKYVPEFVERGRNQVALARFLGKFAVDRLEKQFGPLGSVLRAAAPGAANGSASPSAPPPPAPAEPATAPVSEPAAADAPPTPATEAPPANDPATAGPTTAGATTAGPPATAPARRRPRTPRAAPATPPAPPKGGARRSPAAPSPPAGAARPSSPRARATTRRLSQPPSTMADTVADAVDAAPVAGPPLEGDLAIAGYATLAASQIVPRLTTLERADLEAIGRFERANRTRRTILNRVDQLLADR